METKPTHEQAQLQLELYDLRREARLRQARDWFLRNYFVDTMEDLARIAPPGSETGTFTMMVLSYWEQACAFLNHGLLHEELFFETSGEFFAAWDRVKPIIHQIRDQWKYQQFLINLEKAANRYETWVESRSPGHLATMRQFVNQMRGQSAKAA